MVIKTLFSVGKVLEGTTTMTIRRTKFTVTNLDTDRIFTPGDSFQLIVSIVEGRESEWKFLYYDNDLIKLRLSA